MKLLTGIIKCKICNKNFNYKKNHNTDCYVCSTRKNYGIQKCNSQIVREDFLIAIIKKHLELNDKQFETGKIKLFVKQINIDDIEIKILYRDGTYSKITPTELTF